MFASLQTYARNVSVYIMDKFNAFKRWINSLVTKFLVKMAIKGMKQETKERVRKVAITYIPVINNGLSVLTLWRFSEVMITLQYIIGGNVAKAYIPMFWASFWQQIFVIVILIVLIFVLKETWNRCATIVITRNSLVL